mgnify:CR=1 FL=1
MKKHILSQKTLSYPWQKKRVLVTGGASFIGSHLVDQLLKKGASVRIADDFSSGKRENIATHLHRKRIDLLEGDLRNSSFAKKSVIDIDVVFHLACDHGGRGYVDTHQADCATNLTLDGVVFWEAKKAGVEKIVFASSGCVYPNYLQMNPREALYLVEDRVGPPYDADNMYGWAKLMGEKTLKAYHDDWDMKTASCRFFTVYGERGKENHAIMAMIARSFLKQNPFVIWGDGTQVRNWTYVGDIIRGMILAAEKIDDGTSVNLGTMERIQVMEAAIETLQYTKHHARIETQPQMPKGPLNRVADNNLALSLLGWQPNMKFIDGLHKTIEWYFAHKKRDEVAKLLPRLLTNR